MTQIPGEPLGRLMQCLDGTVFSHSGIATGRDRADDEPATHLASALAKGLPAGVDVGGVRWDRFDAFWPHRDIYCIPMPDRLRFRALDHLSRFRPEPGREGSFSFTKLVTVAAALRSVEMQAHDADLAERLYGATRDVATAWAASTRRPSYYCAELVAGAYGRTFTRADMIPPKAEGYGLGDDVREPGWVAWLMELMDDEIDGIDSLRWKAWTELVTLLSSEDWDFLKAAVVAIARSGAVVLRDVQGDPSVPEPLAPAPDVPPGLPDPDAPIPHALVTPRMLWAAFGRNELCRIVQRS